MNETEELIAYLATQKTTPTIDRLISKLTEQDQEIAELRERLPPTDAPWTLKGLDDAKARIVEQDREIAGLRLDGWVDLSAALEYQRRHRKWALKQGRSWQRYFCFYKDDAVRFHSDRADKAEAEIERLHGDAKWLEKMIELDAVAYQRRHRKWALKKAKIWLHNEYKKMAQYMLTKGFVAAELYGATKRRAEKAEAEIKRLRLDGWVDLSAELAGMKKYNKVLKNQRADVYNEGMEDGKREAEVELVAIDEELSYATGAKDFSEFGGRSETIRLVADARDEQIERGDKLEADNRRLQERVKGLEGALKKCIHVMDGENLTQQTYIKEAKQALQHKEGE